MPVPLSGDANRKGSRVAVRELAKQIVEQVCRRTKWRTSTKWTKVLDDFIHGQ